MTTIRYYETISYGGMEGRDIERRKFETEEMARENAMKDTWNDGFSMYEVTMTFNGRITEEKKYMGEIPCGREMNRQCPTFGTLSLL